LESATELSDIIAELSLSIETREDSSEVQSFLEKANLGELEKVVINLFSSEASAFLAQTHSLTQSLTRRWKVSAQDYYSTLFYFAVEMSSRIRSITLMSISLH
jgi:hypothetical protein